MTKKYKKTKYKFPNEEEILGQCCVCKKDVLYYHINDPPIYDETCSYCYKLFHIDNNYWFNQSNVVCGFKCEHGTDCLHGDLERTIYVKAFDFGGKECNACFNCLKPLKYRDKFYCLRSYVKYVLLGHIECFDKTKLKMIK